MKKRRFVQAGAAVLMAAVLGACSAAKESTEVTTAAQSAAESTGETGESKPDGDSAGKTSREPSVVFLTVSDSTEADAAWAGVRQFAEERDMENSNVEWRGTPSEEKIKELVEAEASAGFTTVVCLDAVFEKAVVEAASKYPDTRFLLFTETRKLPENVYGLAFQEEQAGFLAGFGAVSEGLWNLGFIGEAENSASMEYGFGFLQGADAAALEMEREIMVRYGTVKESGTGDGAEELAGTWFGAGTEAVAVYGEDDLDGVLSAAGAFSGRVLGTGVDGLEEDREAGGTDSILPYGLLNSAVRSVRGGVYELLGSMEDGAAQGGTVTRYGAAEGKISLAMDHSGFQTFTADQYEIVLEGLKKGDYAPSSGEKEDGSRMGITDLNLTNTEVRLEEGK